MLTRLICLVTGLSTTFNVTNLSPYHGENWHELKGNFSSTKGEWCRSKWGFI